MQLDVVLETKKPWIRFIGQSGGAAVAIGELEYGRSGSGGFAGIAIESYITGLDVNGVVDDFMTRRCR